MTWTELIEAINPDHMPRVLWQGKFSGTVTEIRFTNSYKGITVQFDDRNYGMWFWENDEYDKRSKYLRDLELLTHPSK